MGKYVSKPRAYWSEDLEEEVNYPTDITVIEQGEKFEDTGLVDLDGNPVYKIKDDIGFIRHG